MPLPLPYIVTFQFTLRYSVEAFLNKNKWNIEFYICNISDPCPLVPLGFPRYAALRMGFHLIFYLNLLYLLILLESSSSYRGRFNTPESCYFFNLKTYFSGHYRSFMASKKSNHSLYYRFEIKPTKTSHIRHVCIGSI